MRLILIICLLAVPLLAQRGTYTVERKSTLSGTAEVITVQIPAATTTVTMQMVKASVYCSVQCEITLERDGTAAANTALTPVPTFVGAQAVAATAYRSSDVGAGTVLARYIVAAGQTLLLDLTDVRISPGGNFSIRSDAITGTFLNTTKWREYCLTGPTSTCP
jgi:hypothetical protein